MQKIYLSIIFVLAIGCTVLSWQLYNERGNAERITKLYQAAEARIVESQRTIAELRNQLKTGGKEIGDSREAIKRSREAISNSIGGIDRSIAINEGIERLIISCPKAD